MWSEANVRKSQSHVPTLPPIDVSNHGNFPRGHTPPRTSQDRLSTLELSNKALLEEMMHIHASVAKEKEQTYSLYESVHSALEVTNRRLSQTEANITHVQKSLDQLCREEQAERVTRIERTVTALEGIVRQMAADKKKQDVWLKESFSSLYDQMSWVSEKAETSVMELGNTINKLDTSTTTEHAQLVDMVRMALEKGEGHVPEDLFDQKTSQLEKMIHHGRETSEKMAVSLERLEDKLNTFKEAWNAEDHRAQLALLKESLTGLAREGIAERKELSTVLQAEIKTRQKVFNDVRGQCTQVQELCRGSVHALREGLLSLEERLATDRREANSIHSLLVSHCNDIGKRLQADIDVRLSSLHKHFTALVEKVPPPIVITEAFAQAQLHNILVDTVNGDSNKTELDNESDKLLSEDSPVFITAVPSGEHSQQDTSSLAEDLQVPINVQQSNTSSLDEHLPVHSTNVEHSQEDTSSIAEDLRVPIHSTNVEHPQEDTSSIAEDLRVPIHSTNVEHPQEDTSSIAEDLRVPIHSTNVEHPQEDTSSIAEDLRVPIHSTNVEHPQEDTSSIAEDLRVPIHSVSSPSGSIPEGSESSTHEQDHEQTEQRPPSTDSALDQNFADDGDITGNPVEKTTQNTEQSARVRRLTRLQTKLGSLMPEVEDLVVPLPSTNSSDDITVQPMATPQIRLNSEHLLTNDRHVESGPSGSESDGSELSDDEDDKANTPTHKINSS